MPLSRCITISSLLFAIYLAPVSNAQVTQAIIYSPPLTSQNFHGKYKIKGYDPRQNFKPDTGLNTEKFLPVTQFQIPFHMKIPDLGAMIEKGWSYFYDQQNERAIRTAKNVITKLDEQNAEHTLFFGEAYALLTRAYFEKGQFVESLENALKANSFLSKTPTSERVRELQAKTLSDMGYIYGSTGDYRRAEQHLNAAIAFSKVDGNLAEIGSIYNTLGGTQLRMGMPDRARKSFEKAKQAVKEGDDTMAIANITATIGELNLRSANLKDALSNFREAIDILRPSNEKVGLADTYRITAEVFRKRGDVKTAHIYVDSSLAILARVDSKYVETNAILEKALIFRREGKYPEAIDYMKSNMALAKDAGAPGMLIKINEALYQTYKEMGKLDVSLMYFELFIKAKDSIRELDTARRLDILEVEYNYDRVTADLERNKAALKIAEEKRKRSSLISIFIASLILLLVIFATTIILRQRKLNLTRRKVNILEQEMMNKDIITKKEQISDFAMHISEKDHLLETIKQNLRHIKVKHPGSKAYLLDTINFINTNIRYNTEKVQLYAEVNKGEDDFFEKLNMKHPELTDKERSLVIMIRLGKSSKEIALQQHIEEVSVNNYRSSLRKKMGVQKGESLKKYIRKM